MYMCVCLCEFVSTMGIHEQAEALDLLELELHSAAIPWNWGSRLMWTETLVLGGETVLFKNSQGCLSNLNFLKTNHICKYLSSELGYVAVISSTNFKEKSFG